ncbi:MAG: metallophosphoesterase [Ignavibacteriales bacterium]
MKTRPIQYEMAVVVNDLHVPHNDNKALKLFEIFLADQKPDVFIINSDFLAKREYNLMNAFNCAIII